MKKQALSIIFSLCCYCLSAQQATFNPTPYTEDVAQNFGFVATGDVNGDGLTDVIGGGQELFIWFQGANGKLNAPLKFSGSSLYSMGCITVADLFDDGKDDIILGGGPVRIFSWSNNNLVLVDSFTTHTYGQDGVTTSDFDGDGLLDIGISHWDGDRITVLYQIADVAKWEIKHYNVPTDGYGHVTAGRFGPLKQNALVYINGQGWPTLAVLTFNSDRTLKRNYELKVPASSSSIDIANSAAIVRKGVEKPNELWVVHGGNRPDSKVSIWRDTLMMPDSTFDVYDIPDAIQSANLDCDTGDEPVILHSGFKSVTVVNNYLDKYTTTSLCHYNEDGLALGDVNNDGRIDICVAETNPAYDKDLVIFYNNTTPCWPAAVPEAARSTEIALQPNPASDRINLAFPGTGELTITNVKGQVVYKTAFDNSAAIEVLTWPAGMYFITLHTSEGIFLSSRFLKE